ncbi:MAG: FkbM family methyltransferase [Planctomycetes bacterium]|nr:FkbM family methyltransferase [Planctomycetota bacterium]
MKQLSIAAGIYRPARWLSRRIRRSQLRALRDCVEMYRGLLPPGSVCFDVGANIGEKSEALLRAGAGRIVAFEPDPAVLPELRARCGHWKNWAAVGAAVGSAAGFAALYAREFHEQSSLSQDSQGAIVGVHHVPVVTLDQAIQHFGRPFYCKIDVEGWELEVLRGLSQSLPLISFEFHLNERDIQKTVACLERLRQFGRSHVNITAAEASTFHLNEWTPLEKFLESFPGDLKRSLPGYRYGDIFVRSDPA